MRRNGSRHFEPRATPQMGRRCGFQDKSFTVIRTNMTKRLGATVQRIDQALKENRALPIDQQGR